jgi:AraC-like DNA-binding protein
MADFQARRLLGTDTASVWDVACQGTCAHKSAEECVAATHLIFPYRGVYVHHVGSAETIAEPNHVVFFNEGQPYSISHPVKGGDSNLSIGVGAAALLELAPAEYLLPRGPAAFNRSHLRIDGRTQALTALLRHRLKNGVMETLEAETVALALMRRALGKRTAHRATMSARRHKLVDRAKLVLSSDLGRRWTLAEVAAEVSVSPVYLTQVFQLIEGLPLYQYQLQLRLARALDVLVGSDGLTRLALDLGFSSHSHFSAAFKRAYGLTPFQFQRSARGHSARPPGNTGFC